MEIFSLDVNEYKREIDPIGQSIEQYAHFLSKLENVPYQECYDYVKTAFSKGGRFALKDPKVVYLERQENGDRVKKEGTLSRFLYDSLNNDELIAPNFTTYYHHDKVESYLVSFILGNISRRAVAKKAMHKFRREGNMLMSSIMKNEQNNRKIKNNAISGAHVSPSTPLFNPTSHSTLTSNCRCTSGYGNANNEKLLSGNRHYWCPEIVMANITSITANTDYLSLEAIMTKYKLHYPSTDDVMKVIKYSSDLYWRNIYAEKEISKYVDSLIPLEKAAFVYTSDFYQVSRFNDTFFRDFVSKLSAIIMTFDGSEELAREIIASADEEEFFHALQICQKYTRGIPKDNLPVDVAKIVAGTVINIQNTVADYSDMIRTLTVTTNMPGSLARLPESIRRAALTSDTDSTIFTVQDWVYWHRGSYGFTDECQATASSMIYIAARSIKHILGRMTANFGVPSRYIGKNSMKNEFKFDVFVPTEVSKHYFAYIGCQEGDLKSEYEMEIKGVHLRSSNVAKELIKDSHAMMADIMNKVIKGEKLSLLSYLKHVGDKEREIMDALKKGDPRFFKRAQVKIAESYAKKEKEPNFMSYSMWNEVFAPKYGETPPPPYTAIKLSCTTDKRANMKEWLEKIEDRALAQRMTDWLKRNGKDSLGIMLIPETAAATIGIPDEMLEAVGSRSLIRDGMKSHYLVLETLGFYIENKKITKLVSDFY